MKIKPLIYVFVFIITGMILVSLFWRNAIFLSILLILLFYIKSKFIPIKNEIKLYIVSALLASGVESFIMLSEAWSYSIKNIINFPLWLPFLWGLAGTLGIRLYQEIGKGKK